MITLENNEEHRWTQQQNQIAMKVYQEEQQQQQQQQQEDTDWGESLIESYIDSIAEIVDLNGDIAAPWKVPTLHTQNSS